jgi:hypothetical protein
LENLCDTIPKVGYNFSMTAQPNRRFGQFYLSTAILLMVVAAGAVWMNVRMNNRSRLEQFDRESQESYEKAFKAGFLAYPYSVEQMTNCPEYGWPMTAYFAGNRHLVEPSWVWKGVVADLLIALLGTSVVAVAAEWEKMAQAKGADRMRTWTRSLTKRSQSKLRRRRGGGFSSIC